MRKIFIFIFSLVIGIVLILWIYQRIGIESVFLQLSALLVIQVVFLFVLTFLKLIFWTIRWKLILQDMGINLPFLTLLLARFGEFAVSYLTPTVHLGGEVVRIFVLKDRSKIPLSKSFISVILDRLMEIAGFCVFICIAVIILIAKGIMSPILYLVILALLVLFFFILLFKFIKIERILNFLFKLFQLKKIQYFSRGKSTLEEKAIYISDEITAFFKKPKVLYPIILLSGLTFLFGVYQLIFFLIFLGNTSTFFQALVLRIVTIISGVIPIPASLGIFEGVSVLIFQALKIPAEIALSYTLMMRFIDFVFVASGIFIILYYSSIYLTKFLSNTNNEKFNKSK